VVTAIPLSCFALTDRQLSKAIGNSRAGQVMDEAIELALEGRSPYPEKSAFIDADSAHAGHEIRRAADEGRAVVLVAADGSARILHPELAVNY
jgi:hypothetical protein